ncbi:hypothetical protein B0J12DRAFT_582955 [Macrophomina phaseolina]|uniref:FAD-binding domain-containing protein n=1 Tax=Macrophomina phaseolina TaxID=35725 RepID=A0ABQ8FWY5_9PEZI|nr:hypothetical protein B0J12DRAFT_582955 [Macrophomina phaseolina]
MTNHSLKVLIIGAGIGGLTAAIGLRQQGHNIEVFERSELLREYGAAMHLAPNCTALLNRFGIDPGTVGGTPMRKVNTSKTRLIFAKQLISRSAASDIQQEHYLIHRVDLHNELKRKATAIESGGHPVRIRRGASVSHVDCEAAALTLMDGQTISGDVVIAADGVHSSTRNIIAGDDSQPFLTGKSCYRYVTPISEIRKDPVTAQFVESPGCCLEVLGGDRSVIFYPCANNTSLYTGAFLPMSEVGSTEKGWGQAANKEKLLNSFSSFPPHIRALLEKAPEDSVQAWNLLDCPEVKRWTRGRAVLFGDAAHPFLPYMGQGAAMAIEDAACISALLQEGTTATAIPRLLELFQNYRKERVDRIAEFTRRRGRNFSGAEGPILRVCLSILAPYERAGLPGTAEEIAQIVQYCNNHDEWDNTTSKFKEWSARQKL